MRQALPKLLTLILLLVPNWSYAQEIGEINVTRAKVNYMLNCQGCHQADGSGLPGNVPSMRGFAGRFLQVAGGREFLVQVPGSSNSPLSNAQLAELLNWILLTMSPEQLGKGFLYYTEAEVAEMRKHVLVDVGQTRANLVASMEQ
jgi:mono/diheme cytochrome c family protein